MVLSVAALRSFRLTSVQALTTTKPQKKMPTASFTKFVIHRPAPRNKVQEVDGMTVSRKLFVPLSRRSETFTGKNDTQIVIQ